MEVHRPAGVRVAVQPLAPVRGVRVRRPGVVGDDAGPARKPGRGEERRDPVRRPEVPHAELEVDDVLGLEAGDGGGADVVHREDVLRRGRLQPGGQPARLARPVRAGGAEHRAARPRGDPLLRQVRGQTGPAAVPTACRRRPGARPGCRSSSRTTSAAARRSSRPACAAIRDRASPTVMLRWSTMRCTRTASGASTTTTRWKLLPCPVSTSSGMSWTTTAPLAGGPALRRAARRRAPGPGGG